MVILGGWLFLMSEVSLQGYAQSPTVLIRRGRFLMSEASLYMPSDSPTGVPHLQENAPPLGPYLRPMPKVLGGS